MTGKNGEKSQKEKGICGSQEGQFEHTTLHDSEAQETACPSQTENTAGTNFMQGLCGVDEGQLSIPRKCLLLIQSNSISQLPVITSLFFLHECSAFLI